MKLLLKHLNDVIQTEEDVEELKNTLLNLSIRGELSLQSPDDKPAFILIEEIEQEKEKVFKNKKSRKPKILSEVKPEEYSYDIPKKWEWVRLGSISNLGGGNGFPKHMQGQKSGDIPFFKVGDLSREEGKYVQSPENWLEKGEESEKFTLFNKGTIVFPKIGGALLTNNRKILDRDSFIDNNCMGVTPYLSSLTEYLFLFLKTIDMKDFSKGTSVPSVSQSVIQNILVPLPPLQEQKRILSAVDKLFKLCDELKGKIEVQNQISNKLNGNVFSRLQDSSNHYQKKDLSFTIEHMDTLCHTKEDINLLRQSLLNLAFQGKLVNNNLNKESGEAFYNNIKEEKKRLEQEKKIPKQKKSPDIKESEKPFELPEKWMWVRVGDVFHVGTGSTPLKSNLDYYTNGSIPWVTSSSTAKEQIDTPEHYITQEAVNECRLKVYERGTLIIALYGQGKTRGQISELMVAATTNQACANLVNISNKEIFKDFTKYYFKKVYKEIRELSEGGAQPNLNVRKIKSTLLPLPPLDEQYKIVAKLQEIFRICDRLEKAVSNKDISTQVFRDSIFKLDSQYSR